MSLILEALRKSEAERRRGQVPDLHTEPSPGAQPRRDGPPAWLWLALAFAAAMLVAMTLWLMRSAAWGPSAAGESPLAATTAVDAASGRERQAALPVERVDAALVTSGPVDAVDLAATPLARGSTGPGPGPAPARRSEDRDIPAASTLAAAPAVTPSPSARRSDPTASAALAAPASATMPPAPPAPPSPTATTVRVPVPVATVPTATMATATPSTATGEPRRLADLPVDQRRQLPPLKMSMHMWAPTQRFAIIDGARVAEGDRLGDAVVEAITADGVVLAWQGQRLHLPTR